MTKEEFLEKVIFKDDEERDNALFYIDMKGLYLHIMIYDYLSKETGNDHISWKQISDELRKDKGLRDVLYIYLATLEEYIRAYISNKYSDNTDQPFWINGWKKHNKISDNIKKGNPLFLVLQDVDFGTLVKQTLSLPQNDIENLFGGNGSKENLEAIKKLRNCVGHHQFLKTCKLKTCCVDGVESNSLIDNIKNLCQLLPVEYRYGKDGNGGLIGNIKRVIGSIAL